MIIISAIELDAYLSTSMQAVPSLFLALSILIDFAMACGTRRGYRILSGVGR